jgi:hypothetical protein
VGKDRSGGMIIPQREKTDYKIVAIYQSDMRVLMSGELGATRDLPSDF